MLLLALLIMTSVAVALLVTVHCAILEPADPQCVNRPWGQTVKDAILELAPILVALATLRRGR